MVKDEDERRVEHGVISLILQGWCFRLSEDGVLDRRRETR